MNPRRRSQPPLIFFYLPSILCQTTKLSISRQGDLTNTKNSTIIVAYQLFAELSKRNSQVFLITLRVLALLTSFTELTRFDL
ncbi:hypothetical protein L2E82_14248 [Cichorium intybus]|uniref:Uncharacterized protein n=1 Tax=Cichorium intybus TaxID=13427 RepID=A0ACB9EYS5_CICIN|nr:hypothetical protein L2E82_14248 [Cichorium intybus]